MRLFSFSIPHRGLARKATTVAGAVVAIMAMSPVAALASHSPQCGDVITRDTRLTRDLTNCLGDGLVIGASYITLDLNRHTIDGTGNGSGVNNGGGYAFVTIKNGTIKEFQENVTLNQASQNHVVNLRLLNGTTFGIALYQSDHNWIERSTAAGNGLGIDGDGIHLDVVSNHNLVERNSSHDNATVGIAVYGGSEDNTVLGNVVTRNLNRGISVTGANNNAVLYNVVGDTGIFLNVSDGNRVEGNYSYGDGDGIGLENSANNTIRRNIATRNSAGIGVHASSHDNVIQRNWISGNNNFGIVVDAASSGNSILQNVANENGIDGIHTEGALDFVQENTANRNGDLGIFALAAIDGGGNTAHDNGNPLQCVGVSCS